jgi:hypothetical protein
MIERFRGGFRRRAVEYGLSAPDIAPKTPEKGSDE